MNSRSRSRSRSSSTSPSTEIPTKHDEEQEQDHQNNSQSLELRSSSDQQSLEEVDQHQNGSLRPTEQEQAKESEHQILAVQPLSKRQIKRQIKRKLMLEERPARRAAERARKKARKQESKQSKDHQQPTTESIDPTTTTTLANQLLAHPPPPTPTTTIFPSFVVFDCRFDDRMSEKEIVSLDRQLAHSYAINRRAKVQFERLFCTSFNGRLRQRFEANGNQYLRWKSFKFTSLPIEDLVLKACSSSVVEDSHDDQEEAEEARDEDKTNSSRPTRVEDREGNEGDGKDPSSDHHLLMDHPKNPPAHHPHSSPFPTLHKSDIIYLTADSNNVLESVDPNKVYIIGSIVDHNRYKNLCLDVSNEHGFTHAQLPIDRYFSKLKTRKVLTVNQVLDILLRFLEFSDWEKAFDQVIPSRKLSTN